MTTRDVAFAVLLVFAPACEEAHSSGPPPATGAPVRVVTVARATVPRTLRAVGRFAQKRSLTLAFKNGGTVRELLVREGEAVRRGQRLAIVDRTEIDAQVAQAKANVDKADRDVQRVEKLRATQAAAQIDADNAHTAAELAHASLATAMYNQGVTTLVAPEDGRIDKRLVEVGEQVTPGKPVFSMSGRAAGLVVRVGVVDRDLPDLKVGDAARVFVDALPAQTLSAHVSEIALVPSPSGTYEIELRVEAPPSALAAGMTAKVELTRPSGSAHPVVPLGALIDADGRNAALYRVVDDKAGATVERVPVQLAYVVGERAVVASGLSGGERIVSEGASFVEPGRIVRPIASSADAR